MNVLPKVSLFVLVAVSMLACKQGKTKFADPNLDNTHIYGEIGGPAKQLKNTYPAATPQTLELASKFRAEIEAGIQK